MRIGWGEGKRDRELKGKGELQIDCKRCVVIWLLSSALSLGAFPTERSRSMNQGVFSCTDPIRESPECPRS